MCIQQPQDSSQRSAVIAHYNQSSQAHLSSPFWIRNREKKKTTKPTHTKPNPSLQQIPLQLFVLHKAILGEQKERSGLCDKSFTQRITKAKDRTRWRVKDLHKAQHAPAQPAPAGAAAAVHEPLPTRLETGSLLPTHRSWCKLQGKSLPHGLPTPTMGALPVPRCTSSLEARAEPGQAYWISRAGKQEHSDREDGRKMLS